MWDTCTSYFGPKKFDRVGRGGQKRSKYGLEWALLLYIFGLGAFYKLLNGLRTLEMDSNQSGAGACPNKTLSSGLSAPRRTRSMRGRRPPRSCSRRCSRWSWHWCCWWSSGWCGRRSPCTRTYAVSLCPSSSPPSCFSLVTLVLAEKTCDLSQIILWCPRLNSSQLVRVSSPELCLSLAALSGCGYHREPRTSSRTSLFPLLCGLWCASCASCETQGPGPMDPMLWVWRLGRRGVSPGELDDEGEGGPGLVAAGPEAPHGAEGPDGVESRSGFLQSALLVLENLVLCRISFFVESRSL